MISDDDLQKLKRASVEFERLSEQERAVKLARKNLLEAHSDLLEDPTSGPFTVGELIAELQKHPADMPVFVWGESTEPELEQEEVPTPNFRLDVEEVAPVRSIWVLAEGWEDNLGKDEALAMFEAAPVKALMISWSGA